jgi:hypothetical protein
LGEERRREGEKERRREGKYKSIRGTVLPSIRGKKGRRGEEEGKRGYDGK